MAPLVSLPMYDFPAVAAATDAFWAAVARALAARGVEAPAALDRRADYASAWTAPSLFLSQTCGYPYVTRLRGRVRLVATPVYAAPGCDGPFYRSALVVRAEDPAAEIADLRGRRAAFNAADSQSGMNALRAAAAPHARQGRFFAATVETGGHAASARAVAEGRADIAAIDCVTWALIGRGDPALAARLRVLGFSEPAPALPYVSAASRSDEEVAALREALAAAVSDPALAGMRATLFLEGFEVMDDAAYDAIPAMEARAAALGYPRLA